MLPACGASPGQRGLVPARAAEARHARGAGPTQSRLASRPSQCVSGAGVRAHRVQIARGGARGGRGGLVRVGSSNGDGGDWANPDLRAAAEALIREERGRASGVSSVEELAASYFDEPAGDFSGPAGLEELGDDGQIIKESAYLVGVEVKQAPSNRDVLAFTAADSLAELGRLASTAGLEVLGQNYQALESPHPRTYIGKGKVEEVSMDIKNLRVDTVIFDDELSPGQLRNLSEVWGDEVQVADRTALILDIFSQRAATREGKLQVELAQAEYQLPRLTRMWTHLERQAGGMVKGMGEKQIEIDKRLLKNQIRDLKKDLEQVRAQRRQYRERRKKNDMPVISLVGYTNAGKSSLLNRMCGAGVLAEDKLFATLDPTTRRVGLPQGKEVLFSDTVGFIQKLPTQLVAAFRATLEEIESATLIVHVVDVSHPKAAAQSAAVDKVLAELDVNDIPVLTVWNKVDATPEPAAVQAVAAARGNTVCISALTGEGMEDFLGAVERFMEDGMEAVDVVIPYDKGDLLNMVYRTGTVDVEEFLNEGTRVLAHVPSSLARKLEGAAVE